MRPGERRIIRISRVDVSDGADFAFSAEAGEEAPLRSRKTQTSTRSGRKGLMRSSLQSIARRGGDVARPSNALEAIDGDHEDHRSTNLDFQRIGHEELARLHDRHDGAHGLSAGVAVLAHHAHDVLHLGFVDAKQDRGVGLLEKPACAVQPRGPVAGSEQGIDEGAGILVVNYRDDKLHEPSIGRKTRQTAYKSHSSANPKAKKAEDRQTIWSR